MTENRGFKAIALPVIPDRKADSVKRWFKKCVICKARSLCTDYYPVKNSKGEGGLACSNCLIAFLVQGIEQAQAGDNPLEAMLKSKLLAKEE